MAMRHSLIVCFWFKWSVNTRLKRQKLPKRLYLSRRLSLLGHEGQQHLLLFSQGITALHWNRKKCVNADSTLYKGLSNRAINTITLCKPIHVHSNACVHARLQDNCGFKNYSVLFEFKCTALSRRESVIISQCMIVSSDTLRLKSITDGQEEVRAVARCCRIWKAQYLICIYCQQRTITVWTATVTTSF